MSPAGLRHRAESLSDTHARPVCGLSGTLPYVRASTAPILTAPLLALLACGGGWAPNAQQITTPDGYLGFTVECQRTADCYALAASSCPYTYRVLSDSWHTDRYGDNPIAAGLKGASAGQRGEQYKPEVYERDVQTLVIECYDDSP